MYVHICTGPTSESGEDGGHETGKHPPDQTKPTSAKSRKRKEVTKKDEKPPIEATPPGPLVALGQPRQHTMKRPRDIALGNASSKQLTSPPAQGKANKTSIHLRTAVQTSVLETPIVYNFLCNFLCNFLFITTMCRDIHKCCALANKLKQLNSVTDYG